jgi:hypothetical protein
LWQFLWFIWCCTNLFSWNRMNVKAEQQADSSQRTPDLHRVISLQRSNEIQCHLTERSVVVGLEQCF